MHERDESARVVALAAGEWVEVRVHRTDGRIETVRIEAESDARETSRPSAEVAAPVADVAKPAAEVATPQEPAKATAIAPVAKAANAELDVVGSRSIWIIAVAVISAIAFFCARSCSH